MELIIAILMMVSTGILFFINLPMGASLRRSVLLTVVGGVILIFVNFPNEKRVCDVLPKNIGHKVAINYKLFTLTEHGLIPEGTFVNFSDRRAFSSIYNAMLDAKHQIIYFHFGDSYCKGDMCGIYKIDLAKYPCDPIFIPGTEGGKFPKISTDGEYMSFIRTRSNSEAYSLMLLNLKTNRLQGLLDYVDYNVWIDDRRFVYQRYKHGVSYLYLFDINTMMQEDLYIGNYYLGSIAPDAKHLLLSSYEEQKTVLYNLETRVVDEVLLKKGIDVGGVIWMPDGRGFLYYVRTLEDWFPFVEGAGISYYSLDTKKSVRLLRYESLRGGFAIPPNIKIPPIDGARSKNIIKFYESCPDDLKRVCVKR